MTRIIRGVLGLSLFVGAGCGERASFQGHARQAAPAFPARSSSSQALRAGTSRAALEAGSPVNAMFQLLRDYQFPRDEGQVDMTNIYKVLHTADDALALARAKCAAIPEQVVASPFDLGLRETYGCAGDEASQPGYRTGFALKDEGTTTRALLAFRWAPDPAQQRALGVLQGRVDGSTQAVALTMVNLVEYPAGSSMGGAAGDGFSLRTAIEGNAQTHQFSLRALVTSVSNAENWTSLVGVGVSRGAGQHFLFRFWQSGPDATARYYCLPADVGEAGLEAVDPAGAASPAAECAGYAAAVDALPRLERAEAPLRAADFTDGDVGLRWTP